MIEARSPSVPFCKPQAGERERGLCRGFVTLPEENNAGLPENILQTVIRNGWRAIVASYDGILLCPIVYCCLCMKPW